MSISIDLSGHIVLVTGGTRGIGLATVEEFLRAGARVGFCAPEAGDCATRENELRAEHGADRIFAMAADLADPASLDRFVDAAVARWGRIDALVCNGAAFGVDQSLDAVDPAAFLALLQANVVGNFHICRRVLPGMTARGSGSIVIITSIVGFTTMPSNIPYSSSKAALMSVARSLAAETAATGIRVNCVSPGLIKTEASRAIWRDEAFSRDYIDARVPMRRIGQPHEIAAACVFLSSPMASYITAAILPVDGGRVGIGQPAGIRKQADGT